MIQYEKSVEFSGDLDSAITLAKNLFATNGFKIDQNGKSELSVIGPGMTSNKQNPIRGLTKGELKFTGEILEFTGELGGVEFMKKFLCIFPIALGIGLTVVFLVLPHSNGKSLLSILAPLLAVAPWLFISPLMIKRIRKNTEDAIETALGNISKA